MDLGWGRRLAKSYEATFWVGTPPRHIGHMGSWVGSDTPGKHFFNLVPVLESF